MSHTQQETFVRTAKFGEGSGIIITPGSSGSDATALHSAGLTSLLAEAGHLVIRGFAPGTEGFNALVEHYSSRITLDPARTFYGNSAQKVDSGHDPIGLHIENGMTPFAPDLLWFYCVKAARAGSETTVCDGYRVWDGLSQQAKELFASQPIRYVRRGIPERLWRLMASRLANDGRAEEEMTVDDLYALANSGTHLDITENGDGSLDYEYTVHAAHPTKWSERIAWANSILGPSYNYQAPDIRFADGSPIPGWAAAEFTAVTDELTESIPWEDDDIVLIDNSRVMHGRRAITDPDRTILNAQSYAREEV